MSAIRSFVRREPVLFIAALAALLTCFNLFSSSPHWRPCSPVFSFRLTAGISLISTSVRCHCSTAS